jgi:hypothetical protein
LSLVDAGGSKLRLVAYWRVNAERAPSRANGA